MDSDARASLMHRGLDDIFEPGLRASIQLLPMDVEAHFDDAQDLTQEFFARLLAKGYLTAVRPDKGRFRWFLLAAVKRFLARVNALRARLRKL